MKISRKIPMSGQKQAFGIMIPRREVFVVIAVTYLGPGSRQPYL